MPCFPFSLLSRLCTSTLHVSFRNTTVKCKCGALQHTNLLHIKSTIKVHCGGQIKDAMLLQHFHVLQKVHCWVARMDVCKDIINALQLFLIIGIFVTLKVECICPLEGSRSHGAITLLFGKCTLRFRSPRVIDHRWEVNVIMDDG